MDASQAKNFFQDVANMFKGLTWDIYHICQDVKSVRSEISVRLVLIISLLVANPTVRRQVV